VHAAMPNAAAAKTDNRTDLLNLFVFICIGQSHRVPDGLTGCKPAVLSVEAACFSTPRSCF
jgi:hypothetical protein